MFFFLDEKEAKSQGKTIAARLSNFLTAFRLHPERPKIGSPPHGIVFCPAVRCSGSSFCFIWEVDALRVLGVERPHPRPLSCKKRGVGSVEIY